MADGNADGVAIAGRPTELVAVWASSGIQGQVLNGLGERIGERVTLASTPNLGLPAIAAAEAGYYVAFRPQNAAYSVHGLMIGGAGAA